MNDMCSLTDIRAAVKLRQIESTQKSINELVNAVVKCEKRLQKKRDKEKRSVAINDLSLEQLFEERTAIQREIIYIEYRFGTPITPDQRDAVRSLYDRHLTILRTINRWIWTSSDSCYLPAILEHEAMQFPISVCDAQIDNSIELRANGSEEPFTATTNSVDEFHFVHKLSKDELVKKLEEVSLEKVQLQESLEDIFEGPDFAMYGLNTSETENMYRLYKRAKAKIRLLRVLIGKKVTKLELCAGPAEGVFV